MRKSQRIEAQRILHELRRQSLDTLGRSNVNKRGRKVEKELTQSQVEWGQLKDKLRRGNRNSDNAY